MPAATCENPTIWPTSDNDHRPFLPKHCISCPNDTKVAATHGSHTGCCLDMEGGQGRQLSLNCNVGKLVIKPNGAPQFQSATNVRLRNKDLEAQVLVTTRSKARDENLTSQCESKPKVAGRIFTGHPGNAPVTVGNIGIKRRNNCTNSSQKS